MYDSKHYKPCPVMHQVTIARYEICFCYKGRPHLLQNN